MAENTALYQNLRPQNSWGGLSGGDSGRLCNRPSYPGSFTREQVRTMYHASFPVPNGFTGVWPDGRRYYKGKDVSDGVAKFVP